ncbi:3'-5' exonuclease, partial [Candidatus Woesearchaeota archaeon]|nr:3'-5' exonuclease [Candidatus Woesearchaeota archaeon]
MEFYIKLNFKFNKIKKVDHLVFFDIESSGLDIKNHEVIELAWVVCTIDGNIVEKKNYLIKKDKKFNNFAKHINNISEAELLNGFDEKFVLNEFNKIYKNYKNTVFLAHNCNFDISFLNNLNYKFNNIIVKDTLQIFKFILPNNLSCSLDDLKVNYNLKSTGHRALQDSIDLLKVFFIILKKYNMNVVDFLNLSYTIKFNKGIFERFFYYLKEKKIIIIYNILNHLNKNNNFDGEIKF